MGSEPPTNGLTLGGHDVTLIAVAFELQRDAVLDDLAVVSDWPSNEDALVDQLRGRHGWDDSVAPYYLRWLRGRSSSD
ncbi:MAG TPA: hypothetical protein VGQ62_15345 [Chloroflexota bacterium]|nr:hypothetical protein [Chloroflexota bacterium]